MLSEGTFPLDGVSVGESGDRFGFLNCERMLPTNGGGEEISVLCAKRMCMGEGSKMICCIPAMAPSQFVGHGSMLVKTSYTPSCS